MYIGKSSGRGADHDLDAKKSPTLYKDEKDRSCLNSFKDSDKHPKSETAAVTAEKRGKRLKGGGKEEKKLAKGGEASTESEERRRRREDTA
ncbi:hypothetical protein NC652_022402 [Populus alba x Populus x berolinensis]|nr:hypothetical protein NC652_022402 [Populus alba x Populus x berolinensis]